MAYLGKTPSQAIRSRYYYTASGGETSLSGADDNSNILIFTDGNYVDVSLNGATLVAGSDYNTTTANTISGLAALTASDVVEIVVYDTFSVFGGNMAADLNFKDNIKINLGTGKDLQIYHDGSNSILNDVGTGNLQFQIAGTPELEITTGGIDVTGTVTADGLTVDTNTLYVDSTNNRVGVGTTNTSVFNAFAADAIIGGGTTNAGITVYSGSASTGNINFADGTTGYDLYQGYINYDHSNNKMGFYVNYAGSGSPRMSIDSSGSVFVAKTATNFATAGIEIRPVGAIDVTRSSGSPLHLNRTSTDGEISNFYKDGTQVGDIGVNNGDNLRIQGNSSHSGVEFGTNAIFPHKNGSNVDATIDLGESSLRWKNLYLSGGVYLGGTGSANQLHFYEEGTWNITLNGGLTPTITTAHYTVIGNRVFLNCSIHVPTNSSSDIMAVGGLPFATNGDGSGSLSYTTATTSNSLGILVQSSTIYFYKGGTSYTLAEFSNHALRFTAQYRINN